jgi:hypothetical protein
VLLRRVCARQVHQGRLRRGEPQRLLRDRGLRLRQDAPAVRLRQRIDLQQPVARRQVPPSGATR